jgi:hypothetical protein
MIRLSQEVQVYANQEKSLSDLQILIKHSFLFIVLLLMMCGTAC